MSRRVSKCIDRDMLTLTAPTSSGLGIINLVLNNKIIIHNTVSATRTMFMMIIGYDYRRAAAVM